LTEARFKPVSADDVGSAVAHKLLNGGHGHFALRGDRDFTIKELVGLVEQASHKSVGST
jgi:uncharacterized protein YbjT (DUF2867 family)